MATSETLLIIADSESCADLYYATGFLVMTRVVYLESDGRKTLLVSDLEYGRALTEARVDEIISTTPYEEKLRERGKPVRLASVLDLHLQGRGVRDLTVPANFTLANAEHLRELGYSLRIRQDPCFPDRLVKRPEEIRAIEDVQGRTEEAMALAADILARSEIRDGWLHLDGRPLTSEILRREIQKFLIEEGCLASNTIVAGGDQGADPHTRGNGPLPAHQTIIIDILPRSERTRYWGDMTRTFVRGKASQRARDLYRDVLAAQALAFSLLRDGADAEEVHTAVAALLRERGNLNGEVGGKRTGFFHGTGHGVGLEVHELPRIGRVKSTLRTGNVVTVEPGLYYPGIGSVRLEDIVVITPDGCRNLNRFPKELEV